MKKIKDYASLHSEVLKYIIFCIIVLLIPSCFGGSKSPDNEISYEEISFKYPSYWKSKTKNSEDGHFFIECEEKFSDAVFLVSFTSLERDPEEAVNYFVETLENKSNITKEQLQTGRFGKYDCVSIKYRMSFPGSKVYGEVYAFSVNGIAVIIVKQSEREYDLKHEKYKLIENSFSVKSAKIE